MATEWSIGESNRAVGSSALSALLLIDQLFPGIVNNDPRATIGSEQWNALTSPAKKGTGSGKRAASSGSTDGQLWQQLSWLRGHLENIVKYTEVVKAKLTDEDVPPETIEALEEENQQLRRQGVDEQRRTNVLKENLAEEIVRTVALTKEISENKTQIEELEAANKKLEATIQSYREKANTIVIDDDGSTAHGNRKKAKKKSLAPWPIGTIVRKSFPQGDFIGQVIGYNKPYYKIKYEDEDEEEMSAAEVARHLVSTPSTNEAQSVSSDVEDSGLTF